MKDLEKKLKSFANKRRLAILAYLKRSGAATVADIAREINLSFDVAMVTYYYLYQFNDLHSKELGKFSNPYDIRQQKEFKLLVESWLNTKLAGDGIKATVMHFSLDS